MLLGILKWLMDEKSVRDESSHSRGPEAVLERRWGGVREKCWYHWHLGWSLNDKDNMRHFSGTEKEDGVPRQRPLMQREGLFRERIWFWAPGVLGKKRGSKMEGMLNPEPKREAQGMLRARTGEGGD